MIRHLNENMGRNQLIDAIDDIYGNDIEGRVDAAMAKILKVPVDELDTILDDSDEYEGFYSNFTTSQLQQIYDIITNAEKRQFNLPLNKSELYVLIDAMQNYSEPSFTKDREMSFVAKDILRRLREL